MTEPSAAHKRTERLAAVFERVQRMKEEVEVGGLPRVEEERVKSRIREELPAATEEQVARYYEITLSGAAWVARMLNEYDLSFMGVWAVAESLADSVKDARIPADGAAGIDLGVGAGLCTGLWMGLLLAEDETNGERETGDSK